MYIMLKVMRTVKNSEKPKKIKGGKVYGTKSVEDIRKRRATHGWIQGGSLRRILGEV